MPLARPSGRTSTRASVPASALARGLTCALVMACVGAAVASTAENPYETLRDLARSGAAILYALQEEIERGTKGPRPRAELGFISWKWHS